MTREYRLIPVLLLALLAVGCSDISMFSPSTKNTAEVEVRSLNAGGMVGPGESLSFIVHGDEESSRDLQLEIVLSDSQGNGVWSRTLSEPAMNEELELLLPELETGQYKVRFRILGADPAAEEQELTFFYVQGSYAVAGLSSYPPSTLPEAEISVQADLEFPAGADPYVRWTQGDTVLARGKVSEGLEGIVWKAPREPGVYQVTVELFPVPPPRGEDFLFSSALAMTARLFITASPPRSADTLVPEASYYSLFHFDGSLQVRGWLSAEAGSTATLTAEPFGGAEYVTDGPAAGYRIGSGAGIRYPGSIFPAASNAGAGSSDEGAAVGRRGFVPATLTILLIPEKEAKGTVLLDLRSETGTPILSLRFGPEGALTALMGTAAGVMELPSGIGSLTPGKLQRIDLSLFLRDEAVTALWFLDGLQTAAVVRPALLPALQPGGVTVVGGENGFVGVIAELGVYFQDEQGRRTVDPGIYHNAMQKRYGSSLILAEGFEGLFLPSGFTFQGAVASGNGAVAMAAESILESPLFESVLPETVLEIEARMGFPSGSRIVLYWEGQEKGFAEIRGDGMVLDPADPAQAVTLDSLPSTVILRLTEKALQLDTGAGRTGADGSDEEDQQYGLTIRGAAEGSRWLKLSVVAPPDDTQSSLELDRILVYSLSTP